jgi:hypothetical protein
LENAQPQRDSTPQSQPTNAKSDESAINPNLALVNSLLNSGSLPDIKNKAFKGSIFDFGEFFGVIDGPYNGSYVISICLQDQVFSGVLNKNPSVTSSALKELIQKQAPEMTIATQVSPVERSALTHVTYPLQKSHVGKSRSRGLSSS